MAHPNIALVKYWGKRDAALNLPAAGSLSITLDTLRTVTKVRFGYDAPHDRFVLADTGGDATPAEGTGQSAPDAAQPGNTAQARRVTEVLDLLRALAGTTARAEVVSENTFPTSAGLASSASGFAALVVAADAALGLGLPPEKLSELARRGSGSAARSVFGGFAEMSAGTRPDGSDAVARQILPADAWPLSVVVAVTSSAAKQVGSGTGMERSRRTSPFYNAWVDSIPAQLAEARAAIDRRDFQALAEISEHSSTSMHGVMLASRPALIYWNAATVACLHRVRELREQGAVPTFATVDAGPQVKAVCLPDAAARVSRELAAVPGVTAVHTVGLGGGARVITDRASPNAPEAAQV